MKKIFKTYIFITAVIAEIILLLTIFCLNTIMMRDSVIKNSLNKITQIAQITAIQQGEHDAVGKELEKRLVVDGKVTGMLYEESDGKYQSNEKMQELAKKSNFDLIGIIDKQGIVTNSNKVSFVGCDLSKQHGNTPVKEVLTGEKKEVLQELWHEPIGGKIYSIIALRLSNGNGIFLAGIQLNEQLIQFGYENVGTMIQMMPRRTNEIIFAAEKDTGEISTHSQDSYNGQNIYHLGIDKKNLNKYKKGSWVTVEGEQYLCVMKEFDGVLIGSELSKKQVYEGRTKNVIWTGIGVFLLILLIMYVMNELIQEKVLDGIDALMNDMKNLERGTKQKVQLPEKKSELYRLSTGINNMVRGIMSSMGRLSRALDMAHIPVASYEYYTNRNRVMVTNRFEKLLGLEGRMDSSIYLSIEKFQNMMAEIKKEPVQEEELVYKIYHNGKSRYVRIVEIVDEEGTSGIVMDVTRETRSKLKIRRARDLDTLTELYSRGKFQDVVSGLLRKDDLGVASMVMLDIDRFKEINDGYGHEFGDMYLQKMAFYLKNVVADNIIVGRRSGDEFYMFLYGFKEKSEIENIMREFYRMVRENPMEFPDGMTKVIGISAGLAWYDEEDENDFDSLLASADEKLYDAKESGRNGWCSE